MAFNRHAVRHQRQGELSHQFYRLWLVGKLYIELGNREGLTAEHPFNTDLLTVVGNLLTRGRQRRLKFSLPLLPGRERQTMDSKPGIR